jgi:hypothetical protein
MIDADNGESSTLSPLQLACSAVFQGGGAGGGGWEGGKEERGAQRETERETEGETEKRETEREEEGDDEGDEREKNEDEDPARGLALMLKSRRVTLQNLISAITTIQFNVPTPEQEAVR